MRNLVAALVLINLAFFAYAQWIDQPAVSAGEAAPELPRLLLASEFPRPRDLPGSRADSSPVTDAQPAANPTPAPTTVNVSPPLATGVAACVAVGPFETSSTASRAAAVLKGRGFDPRQRGQPGEIIEGYWVHVENISTAADQARVMRTLEQAGLGDASPMQSADQVRHVSVGIFTELARAERRATAVKRLGVDAQVTPRKRAGTVYWLELRTEAESADVSTDGIVPPDSEPIEIRPCNTVLASTPTARR